MWVHGGRRVDEAVAIASVLWRGSSRPPAVHSSTRSYQLGQGGDRLSPAAAAAVGAAVAGSWKETGLAPVGLMMGFPPATPKLETHQFGRGRRGRRDGGRRGRRTSGGGGRRLRAIPRCSSACDKSSTGSSALPAATAVTEIVSTGGECRGPDRRESDSPRAVPSMSRLLDRRAGHDSPARRRCR